MRTQTTAKNVQNVFGRLKLFKVVLIGALALGCATLAQTSALAEYQAQNITSDFSSALSNVAVGNHFVKLVAAAPNGSYVILYDVNGYYASGVPVACTNALASIKSRGYAITNIALTPSGGWVFFYSSVDPNADPTYGTNPNTPYVTGYYAGGIPQDAFNTIANYSNKGWHLTNIAFAPNGGWVLFGGGTYYASNIPSDAYAAIGRASSAGYRLKHFAFAPNGGWVLLYGTSSFSSSNIPASLQGSLQNYSNINYSLDTVGFPPSSPAYPGQGSIFFYLGRYNP